jgi:hypothetical protein
LANQNSEDGKINRAAWLADIRELCVQLPRAIAAVAADDFTALEISTAAQGNLIEQLQDRLRRLPSGDQHSIPIPASDLRELGSLTKVYSSLLERAMRTARLRAALCRTYRQDLPSESHPEAASGWSCEV